MNCLITGASRGLGRKLAYKMASLGYNLFLTYYNNQQLCQILKDEIINKYHVECVIKKLDLKNEVDIKNLVLAFEEKYQTMDLLINNAATYNDSLFIDKTKLEFMDVLETNIVGTFLITKYSLPLLKEDGLIINIASTDGIDTYNLYNLDYAISKAGIIHLTKCMSLICSKIKTIAIAPNWIDTDSTLEVEETFLKEELKRINQKELISTDKVVNIISECIDNKDLKNGEVITIYE